MNYYTPDISEFHVGFEYEVSSAFRFTHPFILQEILAEKRWFKFTYPDPYYGYDLPKLLKKEIRVKCLDEDDILSVGFMKDSGDLDFILDKYQLEIINDGTTIFITDEYGEITLFEGKIRNKSELVILLKQIGI